jgi:Flp pilus assembly protein TadG
MKSKQTGATIVEFALVFMIFMTVFLGILDFARMLWTWNAANEATRWGARVSVVCDKNAPAILSSMQKFLPQLTAANVKLDWYDAGGNISSTCDHTNCAGVNVSITNLDYQWISPIGFSKHAPIPMPSFSTYLPREIMGQDAQSSAVCN